MTNVPKHWEKHFVNIILGSAVASITLLPFIISEVSFFPGNFARAMFFRVLVSISLIAYIGLLGIDKKYLPSVNIFSILMGLWWVVLGAATLASSQPLFSFFGGVERMSGFFQLSHYFIFFFILLGTLKDEIKWRFIVNAGIIGSVAMSIIAILQRFEVGFTNPILVGNLLPRVSGTMESPLFLSAYLLFFIFISLTFLVIERGKRNIALLYGAGILLQLAALFFTDTRSGQLAFLLGGAWFILLLPIKHSIFKKVKQGTLALLAFVLFIVTISLFTDSLTSFIDRIPFIPRLLFFATDITSFTSSLDQRLDVWDIAVKAIAERPLLGYGPENFTLVMDRFFPAHLNIFFGSQWLNNALNIFLDTLIVSGILGFLALIALYASLFKKFILEHTHDILSFGIFTTLLAYLIQNLANLDSTISSILFFFFLAYAASRVSQAKFSLADRISHFIHVFTSRLPSEKLGTLVGLAGITVVVFVVLWTLTLQPFLANRHIQKTIFIAQNTTQLRDATNYFLANHKNIMRGARFLSLENSTSQLVVAIDTITRLSAAEYPEQTKEILESTIAVVKEEQRFKPHYSKPYFFLAKLYTKLSQFDETAQEKAKTHFETATTLSPNRQIFWAEWAKSDPLLGEPKKAKEHGLRALSFLPYYTPEIYFWTGVGYIFNNQVEEAQTFVSKLKDPGAYQYLEQIYKQTDNYDFLLNTFYPERIKEEPLNLQWRASLAITHFEQGDKEGACRVVRELLREPDIDDPSRQSGEIFLKELSC